MDNVSILRQAYSDVATGDVDKVFALLAEDISWKVMGEPSAIPPFGEWQGPIGALDYFSKLSDTLEIIEITPQQFVIDGRTVVVLGRTTGVMRATRKPIDVDWAHVVTFDENGKISAYKEFLDTARILKAAH